MKSSFLLAGILSIAGVSFAQHTASHQRNADGLNAQAPALNRAMLLWSSTFNTPGDWIIDHDTSACDLDWVLGTQLCGGSFPIEGIRSTTKADGWAMIDSDLYGLTSLGTEVEDAWISMANPVDLTGFPNVIVEFETHYRRFNSEQPYLVVGFGDGSGAASVVWPELTPQSDLTGMSNVFPLFTDFADNAISDNAETIRVNISSALAGMGALELQNVYFRLHWTGSWGYAWFVDDFRIYEQPLDDIQLTDAWMRGVQNDDIQYSIIPLAQLDTAWMIGASTYNFGVNTQTNISYGVTYPFFTNGDASAVLLPDSVESYTHLYTGTIPVGLNSGDFGVTSTEETSGAEFGNNALNRKVLVMDASQQIYGQDGIGLHDPLQQRTTVLGTTSLIINAPSAVDAMILGNQYRIHAASEISGIRVMIGEGSEVGGELYAYIIDSAEFLAGSSDALISSLPHFISATDLSNGFIDVFFNTELAVEPGVYFACAKLYSSGNTANVMVMDDLTLSQPEWASGILFNGGFVQSKGNCFGIRMLMGSDWSVGQEEKELAQLKIYPNPSTGLVHVDYPSESTLNVRLIDVQGKTVFQTIAQPQGVLDFSIFERGIYLLEVEADGAQRIERVVLN
jgi:hypothetical protein